MRSCLQDLRREPGADFHDLRRGRLAKLEAGWPLHAVSPRRGHTKLTTTDTYRDATTRLLHELNERVPLETLRARL